jgi:hypothetical protein
MRAAVLIAFVLVSGPVDAQEPATPADELFPLAVGNTWTYRVRDQGREQEDRFVIRAARQEMVGSQTCFKLEARLKDRVVATEHVAFTKEGLCRFKADEVEVVPPVCVLRVPPPKREWTAKYSLNQRPGAFTFRSRFDDVEVPFGRYAKATVVEVRVEGTPRNAPPRTVVWYAAGAGVVKQRIDEGKARFFELELEKFEKAGK